MFIKLKYISSFFLNLFNPLVSPFAYICKDTKINRKTKVNRFVKLINVNAGAYTYIGPRTIIINAEIGKFCSISWDCNIGIVSHDIRCLSTSPIFSEKRNGTGTIWIDREVLSVHPKVVIGSDVWIGSRAILLEGVNVGHGAVIGAGAVVTKNVPPYAVAVGVPAKVIKYRFSEKTIGALLVNPWWDFPESLIKSKLDVFSIREVTPEILDLFN
jgi:acetyltransferase-like isoleucine patch superfamily enzyme